MELFAEIRREYQFGVGTIKGVSRKLGVHRRVVRQALADAVPPPRLYQARAKPTLAPVQDFIDRILEADRTAPRKERHTARRIHDRLCRERADAPVAASTVREYVRGWKRADGAGSAARSRSDTPPAANVPRPIVCANASRARLPNAYSTSMPNRAAIAAMTAAASKRLLSFSFRIRCSTGSST